MMNHLEILKVCKSVVNTAGKETILSFRDYPIQDGKIPKELVQSFVKNKTITTERIFGKLTTVLKYELQNGFVGVDSCTSVDEKNYSKETGTKILIERLEEKIWFGLGFALGMAKNEEQK